MKTDFSDTERTQRHSWLSVIAIALGAFSLVLTEFLPIGLLPEISKSLGVSEGIAGLMVTASGILAAIAAPTTTLMIGRLDRRIVLLGLTFMLLVSSLLSAVATNFSTMVIARVILGFGVGGFWAISIATGARLVPKDKIARAVSMIIGSVSIATVVSVPAGAFIGAHFDWRVVFIGSSFLLSSLSYCRI